jgi:hypothetical protein
MGGFRNATRRSFVLLAATWLLGRRINRLVAQETTPSLDPVLRPVPPAQSSFRSRRYVVNATVILGVIPIFIRNRAGGAFLTIEEAVTGDCGTVALQFGAGSWPDRLKGFNRFGLTQEVVKLDRCRIAETAYLSFMTSSRESNFSQAEQAFRSAAEHLPLTVAYGQSNAAGSTSGIRHETVAATFSWSDCPTLMDELRSRIARTSAHAAPPSSGLVLPTFLYAVRHALRNPSRVPVFYTHNAEVYCLKIQPQGQNRSGETVVTGQISRPGVRAESEFKLWTAPGSDPDLPLRIEFRPKSYLRLTLEADETQNIPVFKRLFQEAQS